MNKNRSIIFLIPVSGIILFIILYVTAAYYYPGGSQADVNSIGFDWKNNYWCNLLTHEAVNGQPNPAKSIAISGMLVLAATLSLFWFLFPLFAGLPGNTKRLVQLSGFLSMLTGLFISTAKHDLIITIAGTFGVIALIGTFTGLYKLRWTRLLLFGCVNLALVIANNWLYYFTNRERLPLLQKITFVLFLVWICRICMKMYNVQRNR